MSKQRRTTTKAGTQAGARGSGFYNLINASLQSSRTGSGHLSATKESHIVTGGSANDPHSIPFGAPSQSGGHPHSTTNIWTSLMKLGSPSGISHLLSGGVLGLFSHELFSSINGLFEGGQFAPPPLTRFTLPESNMQSIELSSPGTSTVSSSSTGAQTGPVYVDRSAEIVGAVRQALLTSSQLNDVISEI